ncbi:MAG: hypothetical protein GC180_09495 [Bacteroidetes bacterium]|nr:hypothetical protein [Bacteroidota bacterium]
MSIIQYLRNLDISTEKWDACIRDSEPSLIYAYSWYLDEVCDQWDGLVLNDYEAVMPLPFTKFLGIRIGLQPLFAQQLGIFSRELIDPTIIDAFLNSIPAKFRWVRYQLNYRNKEVQFPTRSNFVLDLIQPYELLQKNYSSNLKRNLKKSVNSSCVLLEGIDFPSMLELIEFHAQQKNTGITGKSKSKLSQLMNILTNKGVLMSVGLYSPMNHLCATALFLKDRERIYYLVGAMDDTGRDYYGLGRIMDYVIEKHSGQAYTLDFEGSEIPGIARFMRQFGPQNSPYPVYLRKGFGLFNSLMTRKLGD